MILSSIALNKHLSRYTALVFILWAFNSANCQNFGSVVDNGLVQSDLITEASGLAASRLNDGILWTHNDHGDKNHLYAMDIHGKDFGIYNLKNAFPNDFEDIAVAPGPIENIFYVYLGDIGNNGNTTLIKTIYRFPEPLIDKNQTPQIFSIKAYDTINFVYPDEVKDAETIMVDPLTLDIYVISKEKNIAAVYRLPYPQETLAVMTAERMGQLYLSKIVAGDISRSGEEVLLKTYDNVFYWKRSGNEPIFETVLNGSSYKVPYMAEPKGEGLCWGAQDEGYYTISEEKKDFPAHLYFYPRLNAGVKNSESNSPDFSLQPAYPNPFNGETVIRYSLSKAMPIEIDIFSTSGRLVRHFEPTVKSAGKHAQTWNGADDAGKIVSSGVYIVRARGQRYTKTTRVLYVK